MKRCISLIMAIVLLFCFLHVSFAEDVTFPCDGYTTKNSVIIRSKASTKGKQIGKIKYKDTKVTVHGSETNGKVTWYQITTAEGKDGYIRGDLLRVETDSVSDFFSEFLASKEQTPTAKIEIPKEQPPAVKSFSNADVGDHITFGAYVQDGNTSHNKKPIEWMVLAKENGGLLIVSKHALDCKPYNEKKADVTWETCTLRNWLNNDFLNAAFSNTEKAQIQMVTVSPDRNPEHNTDSGNATQDKVFLLSIQEVSKYFSSDDAMKCTPTAYAKEQGAYSNSDDLCWWWLRSPGYRQSNAADVRNGADVIEGGRSAHLDGVAVRPAMWINPKP